MPDDFSQHHITTDTVAWLRLASTLRALSWLVTAGIIALLLFQYTAHTASGRRDPPLPRDPLALGEWTLGRQDAPVALIAYMDFQCPYCRRFYRDTLPTIRAKYIETGRVLAAFRQMPSPAHPDAMPAALAAACAGQEGHFWEMADRLYGATHLDASIFRRYATEIGLPRDQFTPCSSGAWAHRAVADDLASASDLSVQGTPSIVVGVHREGTVRATAIIVGAKPVSEFVAALEEALAYGK